MLKNPTVLGSFFVTKKGKRKTRDKYEKKKNATKSTDCGAIVGCFFFSTFYHFIYLFIIIFDCISKPHWMPDGGKRTEKEAEIITNRQGPVKWHNLLTTTQLDTWFILHFHRPPIYIHPRWRHKLSTACFVVGRSNLAIQNFARRGSDICQSSLRVNLSSPPLFLYMS